MILFGGLGVNPQIDYRYSDEVIRQELNDREDLYEKDGNLMMSESEFDEWKKLASEKAIAAIQT